MSSSIWQNCVARWPLAQGQTTDLSGNNNTLKVTGSPAQAAGHGSTANAALSFSGTGQYAAIQNSFQQGLNPTGNFSFACWIKPGSVTGAQEILNKAINSGQYSFQIYLSGTALLFTLSSDGTALTNAQGATVYAVNTWYHIACVYNGTDMRIYVNGALDNNGTSNPKAYTGGIFNGTDNIGLGATAAGLYLFNGALEDAAIWNRNLSATEVSTLYGLGDSFANLGPDFTGINDPVVNFGKVKVSTGYDNLATSIVLSTGAGASLPNPAQSGPFNLVWWNSTDYADPSDDPNVEIVRCTARSTDTLTVTRAQEGTTASTKNTAGKTYKMILAATKKMMSDLSTKLDTVINVKDSAYGAKGDGQTDDTTAITNAINDAPSSSGVRTVYLPPGDFIVDLSAWIYLNCPWLTIMGAGRGQTTVRLKNGSALANAGIFNALADGITIRDLTLDGNMDNVSNLSITGIYAGGGNIPRDFTVSNCGFINFPLRAITIANKTVDSVNGNYLIEKCYFRNIGLNAILAEGANGRIINNTIIYTGSQAIDIETSSPTQNIIISGNYINRSIAPTRTYNASADGGFIGLGINISNLIISNNIFWNNMLGQANGDGIIFGVAANVSDPGIVISNNILGYVLYYAIDIGNNGCTISGNYIYNVGVGGIGNELGQLTDSYNIQHVAITGNVIVNDANHPSGMLSAIGIGLVIITSGGGVGSFTNFVITGNTVYDTQASKSIQYGVKLSNDANLPDTYNQIIITGNNFLNVGTSGVYLNLGQATLTNLICENNLVPDPVKNLAASETPSIQGSPAWKTNNAAIIPPSASATSQVAGGTLAAATYYIKTTYVDALGGETTASAEFSQAVSANYVLQVGTPSTVGVYGWNVYVSTSTGTETKQNSSPIALGSSWTEPTTGLISGATPPASSTIKTTITNFTGGRAGQVINVLIGDAFTSMAFGTPTYGASNLKGNGSVNRAMANGDCVQAMYDGTNWHCWLSAV